MENVLGAQLEALRSFASGLNARARQVQDLRGRLDRTVEAVPWVGPDRERFLADWQGHQTALDALVADLHAAAQSALRSAQAQEDASSSGGGGGW